MDTISNYRQIRLLIQLAPRSTSAALFARVVRGGRVDDRLLWRSGPKDPVPVQRVADCVVVLREALRALEEEYGPFPP